jgi:hypothetical protein
MVFQVQVHVERLTRPHVADVVQAKTAQAALQEARGFTATIPTTELIKGRKPGSAGKPGSISTSTGTGTGTGS